MYTQTHPLPKIHFSTYKDTATNDLKAVRLSRFIYIVHTLTPSLCIRLLRCPILSLSHTHTHNLSLALSFSLARALSRSLSLSLSLYLSFAQVRSEQQRAVQVENYCKDKLAEGKVFCMLFCVSVSHTHTTHTPHTHTYTCFYSHKSTVNLKWTRDPIKRNKVNNKFGPPEFFENSRVQYLIPLNERWGAGVETQKNVRGEIGGWGRVPFNETYAPSLSTIYDGV